MNLNSFFRKTEVKIFFTVYLIYLVFMTNYGGNFMADSMLLETMSIVEFRTLNIDNFITDVCRETGCDHSYYNGHYYSGFGPGPTFIALPFYLIAYPFLEYFSPDNLFGNPKFEIKLIFLNILVTIFIASLLASLTAVLVYKVSRYFTDKERNRIITTFTLCFATIYFLYSTGYYARILGVFFSFLSFYKLINMKHSEINKKDLFLSGLFSSIAISMDYPHFIISVVLFFYLLSFLRDRRIFYFIFGALIPILLVLYYHYSIFDNPFTTPDHQRAHKATYEYLNKGFGGFNYPKLDKLFLYSFSSKRGLFFYNPILLLAIYGIFLGMKKKRAEMITLFSIGLLTYLLYSSNVWEWWWDGSFGPRYLVATIPYLILGLNYALDKTNKYLFYILTGVSFFVNFLAAMYDRTAFWTYPFDVVNPVFSTYIPLLLKRGFSNYTLNILTYKIINIPIYLINILFIAEILLISLVIFKLWNISSY